MIDDLQLLYSHELRHSVSIGHRDRHLVQLCPDCVFATLDRQEYEAHRAEKHPPKPPAQGPYR